MSQARTGVRRLIFVIGLVVCVLAQHGSAQDAGQDRLEFRVAAEVINELKLALDERWSYRQVNQVDFNAAIVNLRRRVELERGITQNELGIELQKIIALGIDGHAGVSGFSFPTGGRLPFLIEPLGQRFVAFDPQRKAFLADGLPFITKIDRHDVTRWCEAASMLVVKGSPQYIRHRCLNQLREFDYWRDVLRVPKKTTVEIELTDIEGRIRKTLTVPVSETIPSYGIWPTSGSRLLDGNIGYLRLPNMRASTSVPEIKTWITKFRDTVGLIIDVRDNNGGDRDALVLIYSYLTAKDDPPRVFTAAAYVLHRAHGKDHLANNHRMYRANDSVWSLKERGAIAQFAKTFKPQWTPPRSKFSDLHYMVLTKLNDPSIYHYNKPVVVLMNGRSFSATDIFLAGLKGVKGVLLLGTPSAGGSAYTQQIVLGKTPLILRIGSMVSFQADGKLFDGNGINPDVLIDPVPDYFIGVRDNQLEEATKRIRDVNRRTSSQ